VVANFEHIFELFEGMSFIKNETELQNKCKCSYTSFTFKYPAATANEYITIKLVFTN
jgi:hypothetical protein